MKRLVTILFLLISVDSLNGQVAFGIQPLCGRSLAGTKNLLPSTFMYGIAPSLTLFTSNENGMVVGGGFIFMRPDNPLFKNQYARYLSLGISLTPIKSVTKFSIGAHALRTRIYIQQNGEALIPVSTSSQNMNIDQWGYQICASYYLKEWLNFSLNYLRFCEHSFDPKNYQSLISIGVGLRWKSKEANHSSKSE